MSQITKKASELQPGDVVLIRDEHYTVKRVAPVMSVGEIVRHGEAPARVEIDFEPLGISTVARDFEVEVLS